MLEIIGGILAASWDILKDSALFILAGFALAGGLKVFMPIEIVGKYLGGNGAGSVAKAALLGVPLPLCSCSVLPSAMALRKMGASKGATNAFLISTPESGVDSISISYALLDPLMTIFRPVAAFVTAFIAGILENFTSQDDDNINAELETENQPDTCGSSCESNESGLNSRLREGARFAFVDLMDDLALWMVIGFLTAGVILTAIPEGWLAGTFGNSYLAMPVMLLIGVPMYICATSSTPVAAAMIMQGLSPGAALVFLLAGPATNLGSVMIIRKVMGTRSMMVYLASISICAVALGLALNGIYSYFEIDPQVTIGAAADIFPDYLELTGALLFSVLAGRSLLKKAFGKPAANIGKAPIKVNG